MFFKKSKTIGLDKKLSEFSMHYGNNYKDEAKRAYKEAIDMFEELKKNNELSAKELEKYGRLIDDCTGKMRNYTHYNHIGW